MSIVFDIKLCDASSDRQNAHKKKQTKTWAEASLNQKLLLPQVGAGDGGISRSSLARYSCHIVQ